MLLVYLLLCRPSEQVQILVPGAGLGRLAFEIAKRGYSCQGNEFSLFMLFASNFVLNKYYSKKKLLRMFTDSSFWFQMSRGRDISCLSVDATVRQYTISSWRNERIDLPRPRSILTPSSCPVFDGSGRFPRSTSQFISIHSSFSWTSFFF